LVSVLLLSLLSLLFLAKERREIPLVEIKALRENPEIFAERIINVTGYLQLVKRVRWPVYQSPKLWGDEFGQTTEKELTFYQLHETMNPRSGYIYVIDEAEELSFAIPEWFSVKGNLKAGEIFNKQGFVIGIWKLLQVYKVGEFWVLEPLIA